MLESQAMSDQMLLDGLFLLIALLLLPIGFGRGVQREVFVTAGALSGAMLSASWARPWGKDLAELSAFRPGAGQFVVSALFLIGSAIVFGYGGGAAARLDRPGLSSRFTGALLAVINGALVAAILLRDVERFLADDATNRLLDQSVIAEALLRQFGWVLLLSALTMFVPILASLIAGNQEPSLLMKNEDETPRSWMRGDRAKPGRQRRLGWGRDDDKLEPEPASVHLSQSRLSAGAPHRRDTMPIAPVDRSLWAVDRAGGTVACGPEWITIASDPNSTGVEPVESIRCAGCGERLAADDVFCSRCGRRNTFNRA